MNAASLRAAGASPWSSQEWHAAVVVVGLPTLVLPMDGQIAVADQKGARMQYAIFDTGPEFLQWMGEAADPVSAIRALH
jgi:hypothetical protein